jgi:ribosomal-protein-alanine N-acetyltransferase
MNEVVTARLRLQAYRDDDLEALYRLWTDPQVRAFLFDDRTVSLEWATEEIAANRRVVAERGYGQYAMRLHGDEAVIGFCGFRDFFAPPELQLIYGLAPEHWGRGLVTEAMRTLIALGFERFGMDRVVAACDVPNLRSIAVMRRLGMRWLRAERKDGLDLVYYELARPS